MLYGFCSQVYPVGMLHGRLKLLLAQFQCFLVAFNAANYMCDSARYGCTRVTAQRQDNFIITLSLRNRTRNARTLTH